MGLALNKLIVFDLDGTLVDSRRDVALSILHSLESVGADPIPETRVFPYIGKPLLDIFLDLIGDGDETRAEAACAAYREYYFDHCADESRPYPGVLETLETISKHHRMAIATTKKTFMAERVADLLGMQPHLDLVSGTDDIPFKPDPAILFRVMEKLDARPKDTWMVGDSVMDIEAGRRAGTKTCAVTYGIGTEKDLRKAGPDAIIDRFPDLLTLL